MCWPLCLGQESHPTLEHLSLQIYIEHLFINKLNWKIKGHLCTCKLWKPQGCRTRVHRWLSIGAGSAAGARVHFPAELLFSLRCENARSLIPLGRRGLGGGLLYKVLLIFRCHVWLNHHPEHWGTPARIADVCFLQTDEGRLLLSPQPTRSSVSLLSYLWFCSILFFAQWLQSKIKQPVFIIYTLL